MKFKIVLKYWLIILVLLQSCSFKKDVSGTLIFTESNSAEGFEFPYYLFIPDSCSIELEIPLIVEPNNSGFVNDDFNEHVESAENVASNDFYLGNYIAQNLNSPLLVPIFPRAKSTWEIYTHALDRDVVLQNDTKLERIDLQLLSMVNDVKKILQKKGFNIGEKIILAGFSASGTFANRFTLIHPEKVLATVAGGVNGLLMLPFDEYKGKDLKYPIGTSDFENLFDKSFDSILFSKVPQFYFMGELDDNDAIPYNDAFDESERKIIFELLGKEMQPTRWNNCVDIYKQENVNAKFKMYKDIGHGHTKNIHEEILDYFKSILKRKN